MKNNFKEYRENIGLSPAELSEVTHLASNTISQYETGKRITDAITQEVLHQNLRVYSYMETYELTNEIVKQITGGILFDETISTFMDVSENASLTDTVLLEGKSIHMKLISNTNLVDNGTSLDLTLEKLVIGFRLWCAKSHEYLVEQITLEYLNEQITSKDKNIATIDEIGICEIVQYALFNQLLCNQ